MNIYRHLKGNTAFNDILHIVVGVLFAMICFTAFGIEESYSLRDSSLIMKVVLAFIYTFMFGYVTKGINVDAYLKDDILPYRNWSMVQLGGMMVIMFEMITNIY